MTCLSQEEIKKAKKITLKDSEGELLWHKKLVIDAAGLDTGLRKKRDGVTIFGSIAEIVINYS